MRAMQKKIMALFSLLCMVSIGSCAVLSEQCAYDIFPIFIGGDNGSEKTSCFLYDKTNDLILIGGNTTSDDFAPASNEHAFLMAIDPSGNYKWGNFFYNVSYALSDMFGCSMSKEGTTLNVVGVGNSQPVMMGIKPADGTIKSFISLEYKDRTDDNIPEYDVGGAIFEEESDSYDQQNYFYIAFNMADTMQWMRVRNSGGTSASIDWHYEIQDVASSVQADDMIRRKDATFIHQDPNDDQVLYMTGRMQGQGSVIRFQKRDARIRWWAQFSRLKKIYAYAQGEKDDILLVCGDYQPNEPTTAGTPDATPYTGVEEYIAGFARLDSDGRVRWYQEFTGANAGIAAGVAGAVNQDMCRGISYDDDTGLIGVVIQSKAENTRITNSADYYDTLLLSMDKNGNLQNQISISQGTTIAFDMKLAQQALFYNDGYYYFTGWAYGYSTNFVTSTYDSSNLKDDVFVYKYKFDTDFTSTCLFTQEPSESDVTGYITYDQSDSVNIRKKSSEMIEKIQRKDYYTPYVSLYSGGFVLQDTFKIPRPCAFSSQNLTSVMYYRGQKPLTYNIFRENSANSITLMTNATMTYQTGESCEDLATLDNNKNTVIIQTDAEDKVGVQQTLIRDCDRLNRLLEANLYIEVLSNNYPDFVEEPQTSWTMAEGDVVTYRLPQVVDPEGNDEPEVYVGYMDAQKDKYPPFLMFENSTNTIIFKPASKWVRGQQYYFTIVVKERNSDSVKYSFYCTVRITGEKVSEDENKAVWVTVNYAISEINDEGQGSIVFDNDVNMTFISNNFSDIFDIYWTDTEFRTNKQKRNLTEFKITSYGQRDNRSIDFWLEFEKPYEIGLLLKRSDKLYVNIRPEINQTDLFVGNKTFTRLNNTEDWRRLEMIFDWRNPNMALMRKIAKSMYWVLIAIIVLQFILLTIRRVGLLPVWVFIEYLQLVGFMPIYNFRLIPYLYDAFKPSLVSHLIIFDETPLQPQLDQEYFNDNYRYYWLSTGRLSQSFFFTLMILALILITHLVVYVIYKASESNASVHEWAKKILVQFKYNVYIRFYMLSYFDLTFFSIMKINDKNNSTTARKAAFLASFFIFVAAIIVPFFLIALINRKFEILSLKEAKQSFNTLLLKIDKGSRWRVMNPAYFFARRALTAILLTLPIENTFIFLQYVFILMSSHAYILYMVACKPYQTPGINSYVLANETFYSALIIAIFIFSDATPEQDIKYGAGIALMVSLVLLVVCNVIMFVAYMIIGPNTIKKAIKEANLKRAEKEALERAEEEERKLKKKKEEEEFTKIPDETMNASGMEPGTSAMQQSTPGDGGKPKKKKGGKKKGQEDDVVEPNGMGSDDFNGKKRRSRKDKEKGRQDDVAESAVPTRSKRRKTTQADTVHDTQFPTKGTQQDMI